MFWFMAILVTLLVTAILVLSLRRAGTPGLSAEASDIRVYRDQLDEVERDLAKGVLTGEEAEAVRTEVALRLLEADRKSKAAEAAASGDWKATAIPVALVTVLGAALLYSTVGAPGYADLPMDRRLEALAEAARNRPPQAAAEEIAATRLPPAPEPDARFKELMERLRATVRERPEDTQGLRLLADNEARLGNFAAARKAQEKLVAVRGSEATLSERVMAVDLMVYAAGGYVSPEAESLLDGLLEAFPGSGAGMYYKGLLEAQNGRPDLAFPIWRGLLEQSPPNAPWLPVIRAEIEGIAAAAGVIYQPPALRGPTAGDIAAAEDMSGEDRAAMIEGMVEGLAAELAEFGGPPEKWARLIASLGVLGETDRARAIAEEARTVFADVPGALQMIEAAAARAGVAE